MTDEEKRRFEEINALCSKIPLGKPEDKYNILYVFGAEDELDYKYLKKILRQHPDIKQVNYNNKIMTVEQFKENILRGKI